MITNFTISRKFYPVLFLLLINCIFFFDIYFGQQSFFFGDNLLHVVPNMIFWKSMVFQGEIPLWNPYIFAGLPQLANPATNTLSPLNLPFLIITNPFQALSITAALEIFLTSVFMFLLTKNYIKFLPARLAASIIFTYSGTTLAAINDLNSLQGIIFIPLVLITLEHLRKSPSIKLSIILSIILSLQFISGHPQYHYLTWLLVIFFVFTQTKQSIKSKTLTLITTLIFFVGLSAVQLFPFLELTRHTYRPSSVSFSSQNSLEFFDLPRLVIAHIYGSWNQGNSWGPHSPMEVGRANSEGYLGFFTLILVLINLKQKHPRKIFYLTIAIVSFLIALGPSTPIHQIFRLLLPGFKLFRSPMRFLAFYSFASSILVGMTIEKLSIKQKHPDV